METIIDYATGEIDKKRDTHWPNSYCLLAQSIILKNYCYGTKNRRMQCRWSPVSYLPNIHHLNDGIWATVCLRDTSENHYKKLIGSKFFIFVIIWIVFIIMPLFYGQLPRNTPDSATNTIVTKRSLYSWWNIHYALHLSLYETNALVSFPVTFLIFFHCSDLGDKPKLMNRWGQYDQKKKQQQTN